MKRIGVWSLAGLLVLAVGCAEGSGDAPAETEPAGEGTGDVGASETGQVDSELRRLTRAEFVRSLRYVLGPVLVEDTEPDLHTAGLARVGASTVNTAASGVDRYSYAIETSIDEAMADAAGWSQLIGCADGSAGCVDDFVRRVGQRAWRRPLSDAEVERYTQLHADCLSATGVEAEAYRCVFSGLLHSPRFLYRVELAQDGVYRGYAMASRLAYFLWSAPPDAALLDAAFAGQLDTAEGVRAQAQRMLDDPLARQGLGVFVDEWYRTDRLERLERDVLAVTFEPLQFQLGSTGQLQGWLEWVRFAAAEELRRTVVGHVFDDDADYLDLLITDRTYVDSNLESIYELGVEMYEDEGGWPAQIGSGDKADEERVTTTGTPDAMGFVAGTHAANSPRRGILGSMAILGQLGKQNETSPTRRGLYILEHVLCQEIGDPPDEIDLCKRPDGVSRRESIESHHLCAPSCKGCHSQMDPIGFAMDEFDTVGRHRSVDDWGFPLDTKVKWALNSADGTTAELEFDGLRSMSEVFYGVPQTTTCVTKQVYRFATGHKEGLADQAMIDELTDAFVSDGRRMQSFLVHFVGTDAFRKVRIVEEPVEGATPTLETLSQTVFGSKCAPCHFGEQPLGGFDLTPGADLKSRLEGPSVAVPSMPLVTPEDPDQSYLWHKINGSHLDVGGAGGPMPPNGALGGDDQALIRAWIEGGAL